MNDKNSPSHLHIYEMKLYKNKRERGLRKKNDDKQQSAIKTEKTKKNVEEQENFSHHKVGRGCERSLQIFINFCLKIRIR